MIDQPDSAGTRQPAWRRGPHGGALIAALVTLAVLLPLWLLVTAWYQTELLNAVSGQYAIQILAVGGVIVIGLIAVLVYLSINRQAMLSQAVHQRTQEISRINQRLEEDLAQRAQIEADLRASEARSQALLNAIPDLMFRMKRDGTFLDYHADESDMVLAPESVIGGNIRQLPAPADVIDRMLKKIAAALDTQQIQTLEYSLTTAGGPQDFEARMVADGPYEVVAIVRNITERERAEQSLHRWAHIFEHAEWGVAIGSADGRTLELMNPAYARMHGFTVEELSRRPIASVYAPGTAAELSALIQAANETGHAVMESTHIRRDGTTFPVVVDLTAVKDESGQVLYRVANVQDISKRKQAEEKLRTSEAELRALFAAMPDVILVLDAQGRYLRIAPTNPSFSRQTADTLLGQTLHDVFPPAEAAEFLSMIQTALRTQQPVHADYSLAVDGEIVWYTATISPMPNDTVLLVARDITDRKRAEVEVRRSQQQYEHLVNSIDGIVWEGDAQSGQFTFVSPAAERILGYPIELWLTDRNFWVDRLHPADREWVVAYCAAETAAMRSHECDYRMLAADGRSIWLRETVTVSSEDQQPKLLRGMMIDITERKQVEEALREREEQYRNIFEASLDGLFINSLDGYVVDVNPAGARMHGYTVEECRQLRSEQLVHPEQLAGLQEFIETTRAGGNFRGEGIDVRKDGSYFPIEVVGSQFIYRGKPHALALVRDITERVQTEQILQERELQYRSVFESSLDGLFINNLNGQLVEFNPAAAYMHGYTVDEFRQVQPSQFVHPDSIPLFVAFMEAIKDGREYRCRAVDVRKDGSFVHVEVVGTPFTLRGEPHAFAIVRDISAQVASEKALRDREEQYRSVFQSVSDGLFVDTIDGEMVDFNPAVARMHGYTDEEFRLVPTMQIIHPASLPLFAEFVETVKAGREYRCRAVDVRKDGSVFPVEVTGIPISYRGQPHMLAVLHDITEQVEAEQLLEKRVIERTRELSALLDVSRSVASTLELKPLLQLILDQLQLLVEYHGAALFGLSDGQLTVLEYRGPLAPDRLHLPAEWWMLNLDMINHGDVILIPDAQGDTPLALRFQNWAGDLLTTQLANTRSMLAIPLASKDSVIGLISLTYDKPDHFTEQHITLARAIANQAAVALENARLFTEVQGKAVLEERQRLARDLHDSVTQSLYSLTLLAEAGRRLIDVDVPQAARYLGDMGEIAQQSLKEMRLLVYQLRPLALTHEGPIGALQARLDSVEKRAGVEARFLIEGNLGSLSPALEEGLFRVAQEALNNALKHAAARAVVVRLRGDDECVTLEVSDDGRGSALLSDGLTSSPGGLGVTSMRERVTQLHGTLQIESAPGAGTRITVDVPRLSSTAA